jgi:DNA-binding transcriptional LysR family regulator
MEFQQLQYFLSVLEEGSFSKAAVRHRISQQGVSKSIACLEQELGAQLLRRVGRQIEPTNAGAMLAEHAETVTAQTNQFQRQLDEAMGRSLGHLQIGSGPTAAVGIVADVVQQMLQDEPKLRVTVAGGTTRSMTPLLRRGELDGFVSVMVQKSSDPSLVVEELFSERTVLVARGGHPLSAKKNVTLADTLNYPWLAGSGMDHWGDLIRSSFVNAGLRPPAPKISTSSVSFARAITASTDHLCVLPEHLVRVDRNLGYLSIVDLETDEWRRPMALFYRRRPARSEAFATFVRILRANASLLK